MGKAARRTIHLVIPGIDSVAALCALERAARAQMGAGLRRATVLEIRGGAARLSLRVDSASAEAIARALLR